MDSGSGVPSDCEVVRASVAQYAESPPGTCRVELSVEYRDPSGRTFHTQIVRLCPIRTERTFIPRPNQSTSQLRVDRYADVGEFPGLSAASAHIQLSANVIESPNTLTFVRYENDDRRMVSRVVKEMQCTIENETYTVDPVPVYGEEKNYELKEKVNDKKRNCVVKKYKRPDDSYYSVEEKNNSTAAVKSCTRTEMWYNDDSALESVPLLQDYRMSNGRVIKDGDARRGDAVPYALLSAAHEPAGLPRAAGARLEQPLRCVERYQRGDKSEFTRTLPAECVRMRLPHAVRYNGREWYVAPGAGLRPGTFRCFGGGIAVLDGAQLTKYQRDGTVVRRRASEAEAAALAETKEIPRFWKSSKHLIRQSKRVFDGMLEVVVACPYTVCMSETRGEWRVIPEKIRPFVKAQAQWEEIFRQE